MTGPVIYMFAQSLDGFIARPDGSYDWLADHPADADYDFAGFMDSLGGIVMGRGSYDAAAAGDWAYGRWPVAVATTRPLTDAPDGVQAVNGGPAALLDNLRERGVTGPVWLFGGGVLARQFLDAGLLDVVEYGLIPVVLGEGLQAFPGTGANDAWMDLEFARPLKTGAVHMRLKPRRKG